MRTTTHGHRRRRDEGAHAQHSGQDQRRIGQRADQHHRQDHPVAALDAQPQHERVLGADRDDQGEPRHQAQQGGQECCRGGHESTVETERMQSSYVFLMIA